MAMVGNGGEVPPIRHSVAACPGLSGWLFSGPSREDEAWVERWIQVAKRCGGSGWKGSCRALGQWPNSAAERACRSRRSITGGDGCRRCRGRTEGRWLRRPASRGSCRWSCRRHCGRRMCASSCRAEASCVCRRESLRSCWRRRFARRVAATCRRAKHHVERPSYSECECTSGSGAEGSTSPASTSPATQFSQLSSTSLDRPLLDRIGAHGAGSDCSCCFVFAGTCNC